MTATRETRRLRRVAALPVVTLALIAAACGDDDDDTAATADESGSSHEGMTLEIASPADGDDVEGSLDVQFQSSEELGPTDTGLHHVHLYPDADSDDYEVVESDSVTVDDLDAGEHTLRAVLANADHSETDVADEITVNVTSGGGGGGGGEDNGGGGYDYSP